MEIELIWAFMLGLHAGKFSKNPIQFKQAAMLWTQCKIWSISALSAWWLRTVHVGRISNSSKTLCLPWLYESMITTQLRNKSYFTDIYRSMNAIGHMQSKCHPKVVIRDVRKMKFISYNDTYFYIVFCSLFVKFCCKSCKIRDKEEKL